MTRWLGRARAGTARGRSARLGVAVLAGGLLLTSCGEGQPGVAATIDGQRLSVEDVQEITAAYFADYPQARGQVEPIEVSAVTIENFLQVRIVDAMAEEFDIHPTVGQIEAYVDENFGSFEDVLTQMSGVGIPSSRRDLALDYLRLVYVQNAIRDQKREELGIDDPQSEELNLVVSEIQEDFSAAADISVNPRYGEWTGGAVASATRAGTGSLSIVPTPEAPVAPSG